MELKRYRQVFHDMQPPPFNRTIVELKHRKEGALNLGAEAFNRTIVELKQAWKKISELRKGDF